MQQLLPAETSASLIGQVHLADCLDLCERVYRAGVRVDMILADLPYAVTPASWDILIPLEPMWKEFKRIAKPKAAIVLTATEPFTSMLVMSNLKMFRHGWVWNKSLAGNFLLAQAQPMKVHEDVRVFSKESCNYYPQMRKGQNRIKGGGKSNLWSLLKTATMSEDYYPISILDFPNTDRTRTVHPTQKPVDLFRYLIRTYTEVGQVVFDPTCGSGTTGLAATIEKRRFICGDSDAGYVDIARNRLRMHNGDVSDLPLFAQPA